MQARVSVVAAAAAMVLGVLPIRPAGATQVALTPSQDNTLYESTTTDESSGAGPALVAGATGIGRLRRALLAFDTGTLPAGVRVDSVQLVLHVTRAQDAVARNFVLHRALAQWGEGTSNAGGDSIGPGGGQGVPATVGDATWNYRIYDTQRWAQVGGDFDPAPLATALVGGIGTYTWGSTPALVADVQRWVQGGENFGWVLVGVESAFTTTRRFASRQSSIVAAWPSLVVHYTPSAVAPATWAGVKAIFQ
jgi:hypothetical protein